MSLTEIILLAIALGLDCFLVSFSQGLIFNKNKKRNSLALALTMGLFQGGMPLLSYYPTGLVYDYLVKYSSVIVCIIFTILGGKFIYEALQEKEDIQICTIGFKCLILMGIATSIDALGAGVGLKLVNADIITSICYIGAVSFIMSLAGFWIANKIHNIPSKYLEITGGIILIGLGIKALF